MRLNSIMQSKFIWFPVRKAFDFALLCAALYLYLGLKVSRKDRQRDTVYACQRVCVIALTVVIHESYAYSASWIVDRNYKPRNASQARLSNYHDETQRHVS